MKVQRTKKGNIIVVDKHTFNSAITGMLLGDGSFDRFKYTKGPESRSKKGPYWNRTVLRFSHKLDFEEYLYWKVELLKPYIEKFSVYKKSKNIKDKTYYGLEAFLQHRKNFHYRYKDFYIGGIPSTNNKICGAKKIVKEKVLNRTNDLTVAIWYMDDGSLYTDKKGNHTISLHTDSFSRNECSIIKDFFQDKYQIDFNIHHNSTTNKELDYGYKLRTSKKSNIELFTKIVKPFVSEVKCMHYKLPF